MAEFSGALKLTDLNDFLGPSQECVKPITARNVQKGRVGHETKLQKAKISLSDCLACSGCITSAESILISQQSKDELYRIIHNNQKCKEAGLESKMATIIVSISPQSRADIALAYNIDNKEAGERLAAFFKEVLGVSYVFDTTFARDFSLIESQLEFVDRYRNGQNLLPMLASSCPGWICYAEKTHGNVILPYLSTTKSPQQIMGSLVKDYFARQINRRPDEIYHVTIMPCYDKKLEAARSDFYNELLNMKDVDCVLTTVEVEQIIKEKCCSLFDISPCRFDKPFVSTTENDELLTHDGGGSGGYLEHIYKFAMSEIFHVDIQSIVYKTLRNKDFKEVRVEVDGKPALHFAFAYGFRNIQNILQKIQRGKCSYHYVEIMACPGGCLNGGGQLKPKDAMEIKYHTAKLVEVYNSLRKRKPEENALMETLYREWLGGRNSDQAKEKLHTSYHNRAEDQNALTIKW